jgi:hypothetical protein
MEGSPSMQRSEGVTPGKVLEPTAGPPHLLPHAPISRRRIAPPQVFSTVLGYESHVQG